MAYYLKMARWSFSPCNQLITLRVVEQYAHYKQRSLAVLMFLQMLSAHSHGTLEARCRLGEIYPDVSALPDISGSSLVWSSVRMLIRKLIQFCTFCLSVICNRRWLNSYLLTIFLFMKFINSWFDDKRIGRRTFTILLNNDILSQHTDQFIRNFLALFRIFNSWTIYDIVYQ